MENIQCMCLRGVPEGKEAKEWGLARIELDGPPTISVSLMHSAIPHQFKTKSKQDLTVVPYDMVWTSCIKHTANSHVNIRNTHLNNI